MGKSRELKFRGWDSIQEKMLPVEIIDFRNKYISLNEGDNSVTDTFEMIEIMQFTGLQDKNGRDIYEGDVIKVNGGTLKFNGESLFEPPETVEFELTAKVVYNDSIAAFDLSTIEADLNMKHWGFYGDDTNGHLEVIGNIHEKNIKE